MLAAAALSLSILLEDGLALAQNITVQNCTPVAQRTGELGCWIMAEEVVGPLTKAQLFWHLDTYPTGEAALPAKGPRGTSTRSESFGCSASKTRHGALL